MAGLYIRYASPMGLALSYFFSFFGANMLKINDLYCFTLCKSETNGKSICFVCVFGFCPLL